MSAISRWTQKGRPRNKFEARMRAQKEHAVKEYTQPEIDVWGWGLVVIIIAVWAAGLVLGYQVSLTILSLLGLFVMVVAWRFPALALLGMGILVALDPMTRVYILTGGLLRWNTFSYWMILVILLSIPFILRSSR